MHTLAGAHIAAANPQVVNISGLTTLLGGFLALAVLVAGVVITFRAHARNFAHVMAALAVVLLGLSVAGLAMTGKFNTVATSLVSLIFH